MDGAWGLVKQGYLQGSQDLGHPLVAAYFNFISDLEALTVP